MKYKILQAKYEGGRTQRAFVSEKEWFVQAKECEGDELTDEKVATSFFLLGGLKKVEIVGEFKVKMKLGKIKDLPSFLIED